MHPIRALSAKFDLPFKFWIIALIAFINAVSFTIIIPVLYPYAQKFGLNDFQASLLISGYAIAQFFATPILGRLSDGFGRKPLLILSLVGTIVANLLASFTPVASLLFIARILDGLTGGNTSIATAIISDTVTPDHRAKAFGLFDAASRLGFVMGPAISYFAQLLPPAPGLTPLGMSFFASAIMATVAIGLTMLLLEETLPQRQRFHFNWQMFGLKEILESARQPRLGRAFGLTFLNGFTFTIFAFAFQPFFLNILHQSAQTLAIVFTFIGMVSVLTQIFVVDWVTKRFNLANVLAVAIAGRALVFFLIPVFPILSVFIVLAGILGITNSFPMPLLNAILSNNSSEREQGKILGINASYLSISNALGPAVAGVLVSISYSTPFWVAGGLTLATATFALSLKSIVDCQRRRSVS
ncbi:MFS transporter [Phormidium tenue FACHB-886]|nr:MFS transporter [Phormidium tenue FACHB-886]